MVLVAPQRNLSQGPGLFLWSHHTCCAQEALQMAKQCPVFCRKSSFCSVTLRPRTDPVLGRAVVLVLLLEKKQRSWDQQQGWGISIRARHLLQSSGQLVLSVFCHYVVCSFIPKEKKLYVCPYALYSTLKKKGGGGGTLCFEFPSKNDFFGCLWIFLPCFVLLVNGIIHLSCFCCRTS